MLSCMDLYGLVLPGLIPGVEVGVAGVGHDKGFSKVFWVQNPCHILVIWIVNEVFGKHLRGTSFIDLHISNMWSCGVFPTVVWPGN